MILPSKELLSAVLNIEIKDFVLEDNHIRFILESDKQIIPTLYKHSTYELIYLMEEFAFLKDTTIVSYRMRGFLTPTFRCSVMLKDKDGREDKWKNLEDCSSKFEAVVKICEWILKQN